MINVKKIAAGTAIAGSLGLAALGVGTGVANADPGWGHGGPRWNGPGWNNSGWNNGGWNNGGWNNGGWNGGGPGWGPPPPPPPPPNYGYGGWNNGGGCVTGPFGLLHFCP